MNRGELQKGILAHSHYLKKLDGSNGQDFASDPDNLDECKFAGHWVSTKAIHRVKIVILSRFNIQHRIFLYRLSKGLIEQASEIDDWVLHSETLESLEIDWLPVELRKNNTVFEDEGLHSVRIMRVELEMGLLDNHHPDTLHEFLEPVSVKAALVTFKFVDTGKNPEHCGHIWRMWLVRIIQMLQANGYTHLPWQVKFL